MVFIKVFPQQGNGQLIVVKSATAVKEEKHRNKQSVDFMYKNYTYLQFFAFDTSLHIVIMRKNDENIFGKILRPL